MATITVLAGVNGAGKSSVPGAFLRASGSRYFNPDEAAAELRIRDPGLAPEEANSKAWRRGYRLLRNAIRKGHNHIHETTLGGETLANELRRAAAAGHDVRILYVGLESPEKHIERVRARVAAGGHDIPDSAIRRRWRTSRLQLIALLPYLSELLLYDNTADCDPRSGQPPEPRLLLHVRRGQVLYRESATAPAWARPVIARAIAIALGRP